MIRIVTSAVVVAAVSAVALPEARAGVPVYGGPAYDAAAQAFSPANLVRSYFGGVSDGTAVVNVVQQSGGVTVSQNAIRFGPNGVVTLGDLGNPSYTVVYGSNAGGTYVGQAGTPANGSSAAKWTAGSTIATRLTGLGDTTSAFSQSLAFAVNASGTAVGYSNNGTNYAPNGQAVRWDSGSTTATALTRINNSTTADSEAIAVNASGMAVGYCYKGATGSERPRATRWAAGGTAVTELGTLGIGTDGTANAEAQVVSNDGTTAGYSDKYVNGVYAEGLVPTRWDAGTTTATELGDLGFAASGNTAPANLSGSRTVGIDANDTIVGYTEKYAGTTDVGRRAVRWAATATTATELGNLGVDAAGRTVTIAYATNASGLIAGAAEQYVGGVDAGSRAVVWGADGVAVDLNTLIDPASGWTLTEAHGVSAAGWVYGIGLFDPDGTGPATAYGRAFLVQVPEPTLPGVVAMLAFSLPRRTRRPT